MYSPSYFNNPFFAAGQEQHSTIQRFEDSNTQIILTGEALAHEGRALLLAGLVMSSSSQGFQDMRRTVAAMVPADVQIPNRGTYRHWSATKLLPAELIEETTSHTFQASIRGLRALPLAGAFFALSEHYNKSLLASTGKSQGDGAAVFSRRIASMRAASEALADSDGELELEKLRVRLRLATTNEALSYMKRLAQTTLFDVTASSIETVSYYEPDDNIGVRLAKHASPLQRLFVDVIQKEGGLDIEQLFSIGIRSGLLEDTESAKQKARMILQGMEQRRQVIRTEGRFSDGYVYLEANRVQLEYMSNVLEALDKYATKDAAFIRYYGRHALDVMNDMQASGRILNRALATTAKQRSAADFNTDSHIVNVLLTSEGPMCVTAITERIADQFAQGHIPKPVSIITVRKSLRRLADKSLVNVLPGKSNGKKYTSAV